MQLNTPAPNTIDEAGYQILTTADPHEKAKLTRKYASLWRDGSIQPPSYEHRPPGRPARPNKPELKHPRDMPRRAKAGSVKSKIALLHALSHIELNAIDLAWDVMSRQFDLGRFELPHAFYDDWIKVADDEAKHFTMLTERLNDLGAAYGDLPAHDGLWEASQATAQDFAARLAIVPMVLEARGLDVTPNMISVMQKQDDHKTANMLQIIHDDEITHVRAGTVWFDAWCEFHGHDGEEYWQGLVKTYFKGQLKPPFNHPSREIAGMIRDWYEPMADYTNSSA